MEGANRPLEGIERVKHAWPAGSWLDSTVLLLKTIDIMENYCSENYCVMLVL